MLRDLRLLGAYSVPASEFLVHAADVEGLCRGIDEELVTSPSSHSLHLCALLISRAPELGEWVTIPTTYAGGAKSISDLDLVDRISGGKVDLTYGRSVWIVRSRESPLNRPGFVSSSLDIFGGSLVKFEDLVKFNSIDR